MNLFSENANNTSQAKVISVGSGKGGVGKSFLTSSLAHSLSKKGKKILVVDLDFGGANLHTSLGIESPPLSLSQFFTSIDKNITHFVHKTIYPQISILGGTTGSAESIHLTKEQRSIFFQKLKNLPFDYIFLDLGAGTYFNSTDFYCLSDYGIIVILPEPTSIENAYRFIKTTYYENIKKNTTNKVIHNWIEMASGTKISKLIKSPSDLFKNIKELHLDEYSHLQKCVADFKPNIVINQTRTLNDSNVGEEIIFVCKKYFGIHCNLLGSIEYDSAVWQTIRKKKNIINELPNSLTSSALENIAISLLAQINKNQIWRQSDSVI